MSTETHCINGSGGFHGVFSGVSECINTCIDDGKKEGVDYGWAASKSAQRQDMDISDLACSCLTDDDYSHSSPSNDCVSCGGDLCGNWRNSVMAVYKIPRKQPDPPKPPPSSPSSPSPNPPPSNPTQSPTNPDNPSQQPPNPDPNNPSQNPQPTNSASAPTTDTTAPSSTSALIPSSNTLTSIPPNAPGINPTNQSISPLQPTTKPSTNGTESQSAESTSPSSSGFPTAVVIGIVALLVIVGGIVAVLLWRRTKSSKKGMEMKDREVFGKNGGAPKGSFGVSRPPVMDASFGNGVASLNAATMVDGRCGVEHIPVTMFGGPPGGEMKEMKSQYQDTPSPLWQQREEQHLYHQPSPSQQCQPQQYQQQQYQQYQQPYPSASQFPSSSSHQQWQSQGQSQHAFNADEKHAEIYNGEVKLPFQEQGGMVASRVDVRMAEIGGKKGEYYRVDVTAGGGVSGERMNAVPLPEYSEY
ncbi:hypothetical protein HDU97_001466 [Phlyctochytrium planicorne]|nr:hypothetical protein HDU97_001466 [Phlyctochytrium planicorne]